MQHWLVKIGLDKIKAILFLFLQGVPLKPQKYYDKNVGHFSKLSQLKKLSQ